MILYPAIDLKDGNCVRLIKGDMNRAMVFGNDPAAQAIEFQNAGCEWLHLVDLNGAFAGASVNAAPVEAILKACSIPAQLGGGRIGSLLVVMASCRGQILRPRQRWLMRLIFR